MHSLSLYYVGCILLSSLIELGAASSAKESGVNLTPLANITGGTFWFGTQLTIGKDKLIPNMARDGANARVKQNVKSFQMEVATVSNAQFAAFVAAAQYKTEAEGFEWSFVLEHLASEEVREQVDGEKGYGRVKDSTHWMAVPGAYWAKPYGIDSKSFESEDMRDLPAVHVSYNDAVKYCKWAGRRLPTEIEWEYAARGGRSKQTFPWGDQYIANRMNIWEGPFPEKNLMLDGYLGPAPVNAYLPNDYGLYNMVGNVWEWVKGGTPKVRVLRGGSFIDSLDGRFNHIVMVSTRQENTGDSAASNVGFRCAKSAPDSGTATNKKKKSSTTAAAPAKETKNVLKKDSPHDVIDADDIEL